MGEKLKICLTGLCLLLQIYLYAQEKTENIIRQTIPDSLTRDADAVCRLDETEVEIKSPAKIIVRERHIYTILNEKAEQLGRYIATYDKLSTLNYVSGTLYNSLGKEVNHFKKKDMSDFTNEGAAFVSDERLKLYSFTYNSYPYTVEFEQENEIASAYYIPEWTPTRTEKMSLELSRYTLSVPSGYKVRLKMINGEISPLTTEKKDNITYNWEIRNRRVIPDEPYAVSPVYFDPFMLVAPTDFELAGYKGNISTWKDYGKFYYSLYEGKDVLPEELKVQVHKLTDHIQDPYKKIAILYDYLQNNTHYVLIMFGIGGLQPYDAAYVAKNKYGDCKALSNFMVALLKEVGIKGYPVAIWGGEEPREFVTDFPSHQANHIICAVPVEKDTVWLECTSQSLPPGYLSAFTANRYGLMVNEEGGTLVHTPIYLLKDNVSIRKLHAVLDADGNLQIKSETSYKALSGDQIQSLIHENSHEIQLDYLKRNLNLPTYSINTFNYSEDNSGRLPIIHETLDITVSGYAHITGKRIFIDPDILRRSTLKFPDDDERKLDLQFKNEYREVDSSEITIPADYRIESKPLDMLLETQYGRYQTHLVIVGNKIQYYRSFDHLRGRFPPNQYKNVREFYNRIFESDHTQIVFVRNN